MPTLTPGIARVDSLWSDGGRSWRLDWGAAALPLLEAPRPFRCGSRRSLPALGLVRRLAVDRFRGAVGWGCGAPV